jgi:serine/threonine protein kinase
VIDQTISHYKIIEKLGGGGMGVVYKAEDMKLKRTVALKFLPPEFTSDPEAKERFIHEAQAASSLDHTNICTVYEIGETEDGKMFIAMACYEGETLKDRVARGPLKTDEAISLTVQIADGLAEAHQHGIIHRDIKPANILITKNGIAKIVDFGLAKVAGLTRLTKTGSTLGTIAYMAPEQLHGVEVDARTDIFSLAVVLYEMLSGKRPFRGDHEAALMYSIINEEPEQLQKLIPEIPPELNQIIIKALEKDPKNRYQSMNDLLIDLRPFKKETSKTSSLTIKRVFIDRRSTRIIVIGVIVFAVVLVSVIGIFLIQKDSRVPSTPMVTRILKIGNNNAIDPCISPDGNWIVYVARDSRSIANIYVVSSSGGEPKKILHDTTDYYRLPCFSPDASKIVYSKDDGSQINIVPTLGGASRKLVNDARYPRWSPDGKLIAFFRSDGEKLFVVNSNGTGEKEITKFINKSTFYVAWSPDSKRLAFLRSFQTSEDGQYTEIFSRALDDSAESQITFDKKQIIELCWASTGEIIYSSNCGGGVNLWIISDGGGTPRQLTVGAGGDRDPCISKDAHRLVYLNNFESINIWTIDLQNKQLQQLTFEDAKLGSMSYSWDSNKLIYFQQRNFNESEHSLVVCNTDGSESTKLLPKMDNYSPDPSVGAYWSSDMRSVYFSGIRNDTLKKNPDSIVVNYGFFEYVLATNETRKVGDGALIDISRNGKYLIYSPDLNSSARTVLAETSAPNKPIKTEITTPWNRYTRFSWDSKSTITPVPDSNNSSSTSRIWITSLDGRKKEYCVHTPKNFHFVKSMPDGISLLGTIFDETLNRATLVKISIPNAKIEEIAKLPFRTLLMVGEFYNGSVTPDGKTLAFSIYDWKSRIMVLDNFR